MQHFEINGINIVENGKINFGLLSFILYDTYGFPFDLTKQIIKTRMNIEIDENDFNKYLDEQKKRSKNDRLKNNNIEAKNNEIFKELELKLPATEKLFYKNELSCEAKILALIFNGNIVNKIEPKKQCWIILDKTPFYATSGGEVGDVGMISKSKVLSTEKLYGNIIGHLVDTNETFEINDNISCFSFRKNVCKNHTATHLLQSALKIVLGNDIQQKGSQVDENGLRFDFSSNSPMTNNEIKQVESIVNNWVSECLPVKISEMKKEEAEKIKNVVKLFDEKYGDKVRVVSVFDSNENPISIEFCGGMHCKNTGEIEEFTIESEKSIGSGIRRIKAITGKDKCSLLKEVIKTKEQVTILQEEYEKYKSNTSIQERFESIYNMIKKKEETDRFVFLKNNNKKIEQEVIKIISRHISNEYNKPTVAVTINNENKYFCYIMNLSNEDFDCNAIAQEVIKKKNGKGGGNKKSAQFTCQDEIKISDF